MTCLSCPALRIPVHSAIIALSLTLLATVPGNGKTRWSALHLVPDADFLSAGQIVPDFGGFFGGDSSGDPAFRSAGLVHLGVTEWINVYGGFAGGATLGFKAKILGEIRKYAPSLAIGAHNIISHRESYYFGVSDSAEAAIANEFYVVAGKAIEAINMRFHAGLQTIPRSEKDGVNPFLAVENYFGMGLYSSLEVHRRHEEVVPSLFLSLRFLAKKMEISAGLIAIDKLLFKDGKFSFSLLSPADETSFAKPGVWLGMRYLIDLGRNKGGFLSIEDRLMQQQDQIDTLRQDLLELRSALGDGLSSAIRSGQATDSDRRHIKTTIMERLIALRGIYSTEPFEPEKVRAAVRDLVAFRDRAVPGLKEMLLDKGEDRQIRALSATILGEIGSRAASDALLDICAQEQDPEIRIESLIALGKMKETRAVYLMEQLANDPDESVALAAQEVLLRIEKETGVSVSRDAVRRAPRTAPDAIVETTIRVPGNNPAAAAPGKESIAADTKPAPSTPSPAAVPVAPRINAAPGDSVKKDASAAPPVKSMP